MLHLTLPRHKDQNAALGQLPVYLADLHANKRGTASAMDLATSTMVSVLSLTSLQGSSSAMMPQADANYQGSRGDRQGRRC